MDLRLGCHEPRLDGGDMIDDLGERFVGLSRVADPLNTKDEFRLATRCCGDMDLFRAPDRGGGSGKAGTEGLVKPL